MHKRDVATGLKIVVWKSNLVFFLAKFDELQNNDCKFSYAPSQAWALICYLIAET